VRFKEDIHCLARSLYDLKKAVAGVSRDLAIVTEALALYVRYFLTMTPPQPQSDRQAAQLLGRERFQVFVAQVGRRLARDHRLVSEVLETIAVNNPDLFCDGYRRCTLEGRRSCKQRRQNRRAGSERELEWPRGRHA
jgi:hypothetical protein